MELDIKVDKSYRTRGGNKETIEAEDPRSNLFPWVARSGKCYTLHGSRESNRAMHVDDLVAEWAEPATPDADGWITWAGGECPVPGDTVVEVRGRFDGSAVGPIAARGMDWISGNHTAQGIAAYRVVSPAPMPVTMHPVAVHAPDILDAAAGHMRDRATTYDSPAGERSMARTVAVFNALHGTVLTESQGWSFMECLKAVRSFQNGFNRDSVEDGAAYVALRGEAQARAEAGQ